VVWKKEIERKEKKKKRRGPTARRLLIGQDDKKIAALDWSALLSYMSQHCGSTTKA